MYRTANGNPCDDRPASIVTLNHVPIILKPRLLAAFGPTPEGYCDPRALFEHWGRAHTSGMPWLDHWGSAIVNRRQTAVSEPYLCVTDDFSEPRHFADAIGCELLISERSHWFPGETLRLAFAPRWLDVL